MFNANRLFIVDFLLFLAEIPLVTMSRAIEQQQSMNTPTSMHPAINEIVNEDTKPILHKIQLTPQVKDGLECKDKPDMNKASIDLLSRKARDLNGENNIKDNLNLQDKAVN